MPTLHDAACAVWTEAHCEDSHAAAQHTEWRRIVCGINVASGDVTPKATVSEGARLIHFAADLAAATGATIHLVHAVPVAESGPEIRPERYMDLEFAAFLADEARKKIAEMQKEAGTNSTSLSSRAIYRTPSAMSP
jgi:Universal stress protein family